MSLLGTATALDTLRETADEVELHGRVTARLSAVQSIFGPELAYLEVELAKAAADGKRPATDAAGHLVEAGGKRVRPLTVLLAAACFGPLPPAARELAVVAEFVHTATLLHDDVIDDSPDRRGKAAARTVWGNAISVLAGDLLLTHALDRTFGPQVVFQKTPPAGRFNLAPSEGSCHFGQVKIDGKTGELTVTHRDASGAALHTTKLAPL